MQNLFYPNSIVTFRKIMEWEKQGDDLSEEQRQKTADYLTIKKQVEHKWSKEDKKRFLKVKKLLKTQKSVIASSEEVEA